MLVKRVEDELQEPAYLDVQRTFHHKKQALGKMIEYMKKRSLMLKDRIQQNQAKLKELSAYCQVSNPVVMKREATANEMMLNIYNPLYYNRKTDQDQYLIPVKNFEKEIEERSGNKRLFFDVVLNMRKVSRIVVPAAELLHKKFMNHDDKITRDLVMLGELKMFEKLRKLFNGTKTTVCLLDLEGVLNFKLTTSDTLESTIDNSQPLCNNGVFVVSLNNLAKSIPLYSPQTKLFNHSIRPSSCSG